MLVQGATRSLLFDGPTPEFSRLHGVAKPRNAGRLERLVMPP